MMAAPGMYEWKWAKTTTMVSKVYRHPDLCPPCKPSACNELGWWKESNVKFV
jgi:hypothetical protein